MDLAAAQGILLSRPRGRPPVLSREDRQEIARRFHGGAKAKDLAKAFNVKQWRVYEICANADEIAE